MAKSVTKALRQLWELRVLAEQGHAVVKVEGYPRLTREVALEVAAEGLAGLAESREAIQRAGAGTLAEVCAGIESILESNAPARASEGL